MADYISKHMRQRGRKPGRKHTPKLSLTPLLMATRTAVLVVDDDEGIRESLAMVLEDEGYTLTLMSTVGDAQRYLQGAPDRHVVVLDFLLPGGTAEVLLQAVEQDARLQRHRYILLPASPITEFSAEAQRLIHARCTAVVNKPFDLEDFLAVVARATEQLNN